MRPAWVEIDTSAIRDNTRAITEFVGARTGVLAVVKADGYGHGLLPTARAALAGGARMLGVAILDEAAQLRAAGVTESILIMGCSMCEQAQEIVAQDISAVVSNLPGAQALAEAARERGTHARLHVKVNTGMGRVGARWDDAVAVIRAIAALPGVEIEGVMTHFATADYEDQTSARTQLARFTDVLDEAARHGIRPRYRHCANSAAITFLKESHLDMVRPGLILYGVPPVPMAADIAPETGFPQGAPLFTKRVDYARERSEETRDRYVPFKIRPALSLKTRVVQVSNLLVGDGVGYGLTYRAGRDSTFALLPLGYADGVSRAHSNRGWVLIHGQRAPIVGRVSMDQTIIDITSIPGVTVGDQAVLIGEQEGRQITAWEVGLTMGSIAYEALVMLSDRLPRVYIDG